MVALFRVMARLSESTRLHTEGWRLHAERATDSGYVSATIDLTEMIGNHEGKLVVGEDWKSTEQWRRWASKELRGTILRANLRIGDLSWNIRGTWVLDEIDLNEHVYWQSTELKFGQIPTEEEGNWDNIRNLVGTDLLDIRNGVLSAISEGHVQTINLNQKLGNSDGRFEIGGVNFSMSARDCTLNRTILSGQLRQVSGQWVQDQVDLGKLLRWRDGALEFSSHKITTQPVVPMECSYCRPLFRHGRFFLPIDNAPIHLKPPLGTSACPMCLFLRLIVRQECVSEGDLTELVLTPSLYKSYRQAVVEVRHKVQSSDNGFVPRATKYVIYNRAGMNICKAYLSIMFDTLICSRSRTIKQDVPYGPEESFTRSMV